MARSLTRESFMSVAVCLCGCAASRPTVTDSIAASDECNGFVLRLTVSPRSPKAGDTLNATATIENTTGTNMAVHHLSIVPQYIDAGTEERAPIVFTSDKYLQGWRVAYSIPFLLEGMEGLAGVGGGFLGELFPIWLAPDTSEIKKECATILGMASFGDFYPSYVIPAHSTITMSASFEATPDRNWIDVGLFCLENYFSKAVLEKSEERSGDPRLWHYGTVKLAPKIWLGSLYVGVKIEAE